MPVAGVRVASVDPRVRTEAADWELRHEPHTGSSLLSHRHNEPFGQDSGSPGSVRTAGHVLPTATTQRRESLRQSSPRRILSLLATFAIVGTTAVVVLSGNMARKPGSVLGQLDQLAERAGLGLNQVHVTGHRFTADTAIFDSLELDRVRSLVSFDALAARERIEKLPWVNTATMTRLLPDTLVIAITERTPAAVWQLGDRETLIDAGGRRLGGIRSGGAPDLPRIAGIGAPDASAALFAQLARYPEITSRLLVAERVGQRRWTLRLSGDLDVLLPADLDARPFHALQRVVSGKRLLDAGAGQLDLRHADRVVALPATHPSRLTASPQARAKQSS